MKMLEDYMRSTLKSEVETIDATDLRKHLGECLTQTWLGKSFCIYRKGKMVAFLVTPENADVMHHILPDGSAPTLNLSTAKSEANTRRKNVRQK